MTTNSTTATRLNPAPVRPADELAQLLEANRHATAEIYTALRLRLANEASLGMNPPPQAYTRRVQQLEKAFELYRQAEARIELLVAHFGGTL
jgi:hypothetical protein